MIPIVVDDDAAETTAHTIAQTRRLLDHLSCSISESRHCCSISRTKIAESVEQLHSAARALQARDRDHIYVAPQREDVTVASFPEA